MFPCYTQELESALVEQLTQAQEQTNQALDVVAKLRHENATLSEEKRRLEQAEDELVAKLRHENATLREQKRRLEQAEDELIQSR